MDPADPGDPLPEDADPGEAKVRRVRFRRTLRGRRLQRLAPTRYSQEELR
jgi:hypothetical protein